MPNAEKVTAQTEIRLGGKIRRLKCDMWALAMMETATGESAMRGQFFQDMSLNKLVTMVWAFLLEDDEVETITRQKGIEAGRKLVAKWIDFERFEEILSAAMQAFNAVKAVEPAEGNAPLVGETAQTETGSGAGSSS